MLLVISPAKTLDYTTAPTTEKFTRPDFLHHSQQLIDVLRHKTPAEIGSLMDISDQLAVLNVGRYQQWHPGFDPANAKQALLAFMGDVYAGMDAASFNAGELDYAQRHLRILSGLYGVLRPLDLMQPYRLEMGTRLANPRGKDLYGFWGDIITDALNAELAQRERPLLLNLASEEYFKAVRPKRLAAPQIDCVFQDRRGDGAYKIVSFYAKRARGLMARFVIRNRIDQPDGLRDFDLDGYRFEPAASEGQRLVFRRTLQAA